jgi:FkbM family methyltransferase
LRRALHSRSLELPRRRVIGGRLAPALRRTARTICPRTVIDVGVAYGTPGLYRAFESATLLLVEPLVEYEPSLRDIVSRYEGTYVLAAAGETETTASIYVADNPSNSSMYVSSDATVGSGEPREVSVVRLDSECERRGLPGPFVLKLDVQGGELQALAGAERILPATELVIVETSLFGFYVGAPEFVDVVAWMAGRGFVPYEIVGGARRPLDGALAQLDVLFAREDGELRQSHRFGASG